VQRVQYAPPVPATAPEPIRLGVARPEIARSPLTLADLESMALAGNPSIARAAALVEAARGNYIQVGLHPNPVVGYEGQQIGSGGRAEQDGVFVEQEFVRGGKLRLNRQVAAQEWARLEQQLAAQQQRVLTDVRRAYFHVLIAQEEEKSLPQLDKFRRQSLQQLDNLFNQGEISYQQRYQLSIEIANAQNLFVRARNRRAAAWESLAAVIGQPHLPLQELQGNPDSLPTWQSHHDVMQRLLTTSPEVAAAMASIERARWAAERARVESVPNVTVQGLYNWRDNGIGGDPDGAVTVGVPIPIWNRNQGRIIEAAQEAAAAERALQQLELNLQNRLAPVYERYANAFELVQGYQRAGGLKELDESVRRTQSLWPAEIGTSEFLTEIRAYYQIRMNYFDALRDLHTSAAEIEGLLLSESLQQELSDR
jgi:cobalt-zinc-cadmium efflux system outer membrane protein